MNWSISLLFVSVLFTKSCCGEKIYITAFPNGVPCPSDAEICHNISFFSAQVNDIGNNTEIIFLEGIHQLPSEAIVIQNVVNVTLRGNGSASVLQCSESGGIVLAFTEYVTIAQLTFKNCGTPNNDSDGSLVIYESVFVNVTSVIVYNSTHSGLIFTNVLNISVSNCMFKRKDSKNSIFFPFILPAGIFGMFRDSAYMTGNGYVDIEDTSVSLGISGLYLVFSQQSYLVNTTVKSSHFTNKVVNINIFANRSCLYNLNFDQIVSNYAFDGIGFVTTDCITKYTPVITVSNSTISYNYGRGIAVDWYSNSSGEISISNSSFIGNIGLGSISVYQSKLDCKYLKVTLVDLRFHQNKHFFEISEITPFTLSFNNIKSIMITDCAFTNNNGSAIFVYDSVVTFSGTNTFMNNTGVNGGGLFITGGGYIVLSLQVQLRFINNHAENNGGAIYVEQPNQYRFVTPNCFYQLQEPIVSYNDVFVFQNNTAGTAGSAVYAGGLDHCISIVAQQPIEGVFSNISSFIFNQTGNTVISSNPHQVCFCSNESINCNEINRSFIAFPGKVINVSVVLVGEQNGYTSGVVQITSSSSEQMNYMNLNPSCSNLSYTVLGENSNVGEIIRVDLTVRAKIIEYDLSQRALRLYVTIVHCSEGFHLLNEGKCECFESISKHSEAQCFPSSQTIQRSGNVWIGKSSRNDCTVVVSNCSLDYCNSNVMNLSNLSNLAESDVQCNDNRAGQLCGKCKDDFSLVLGSNKCINCSNKNDHAAIIIAIGLMGILLVCLIFLINLTVSVGTINGLIFFANIVKLYESFFPIQSIPFLNQFISWINLDLGIETCFYDGMTALIKVGLQFLFPFYLWLIVIVVIIACKRSSRIARFTGNNTIPVLATVILLSYTKLLRTVIKIFSRTTIDCDNITSLYWSIAPTQEYFHGWHILLFVIGIVVMVFLIVPFTLFLLLFPLLELSNEKCRQRLSWFMIRLKPFFDAYRGPHTDIFCFWPGALVVVRIGLALTVAFPTTKPLVVLFVTMLLLISIYGVANIYKPGQYVYFLDIGLLVNLAFLANLLKTTHRNDFEDKSDYPYIGVTLILTFAFIVFVGVLLYHIFKYTYLRKICSRILKKKTTPIKQVPMAVPTIKKLKRHDFSQLRESLLDEPY